MLDFITTLNGGVLAGIAAIAVIALIATQSASYGETAAYRMSMRARLPFGSDTVAASVRRRARAVVRANMWGLLATVGVSTVIFATTPLSASPQFLWIVTLLILVGALTGASLIVNLRERLFAPAPTAVRIARARPLGVCDYLGPWRRTAPGVLVIGAVLACCALGVTQALLPVDPLVAALAYVSLTGAVVIFLAARIAERAVLAQAQPASDTLELAWDDLFRADTLSALRMGAAMAAWLPFGLAVTLTATSWLLPSSTTAGLFPWWGVPALQVLYILGQGKLPEALYPDFLRMPAIVPTEHRA